MILNSLLVEVNTGVGVDVVDERLRAVDAVLVDEELAVLAVERAHVDDLAAHGGGGHVELSASLGQFMRGRAGHGVVGVLVRKSERRVVARQALQFLIERRWAERMMCGVGEILSHCFVSDWFDSDASCGAISGFSNAIFAATLNSLLTYSPWP